VRHSWTQLGQPGPCSANANSPRAVLAHLTTRHLLLHSDAIAALPELITWDDPGLTQLPTPLPSVSSRVGVTEAAGRAASPATRALTDCLRAVAADLRMTRAGQ
jgi:DNA-binding transcriptional LysR family regulator